MAEDATGRRSKRGRKDRSGISLFSILSFRRGRDEARRHSTASFHDQRHLDQPAGGDSEPSESAANDDTLRPSEPPRASSTPPAANAACASSAGGGGRAGESDSAAVWAARDTGATDSLKPNATQGRHHTGIVAAPLPPDQVAQGRPHSRSSSLHQRFSSADTPLARPSVRQQAIAFLGSINLQAGPLDAVVLTDSESLQGDGDSQATASVFSGLTLEQTSLLVNNRVFYQASQGGVPFLLSSMLAFNPSAKRRLLFARDLSDDKSDRPKGTKSYGHLLKTTDSSYSINLLDDPDFRRGKHQKVFNLSSYRVSISLHVKPADLKKDINAKFREQWPHIDLTLSKLRSLKRDMVYIGTINDLDISTIAMAHIHFEKLVLKEAINKPNRKVYAAACLLMALKFQSNKLDLSARLAELFKTIEELWRVPAREVMVAEFPVLVLLEFDLHLEVQDVLQQIRCIERTMPERNT